MDQSKWEYRENFHQTGGDDYDGHYEVTDGNVFLCTNDDPEDITETENSLQQIARLLNESGCKFYCDTQTEHALHVEAELAKMERDQYKEDYTALRAKCDKMEQAIKSVYSKGAANKETIRLINEALEQEGEKEPTKPQQGLTPEEVAQRKEAIEWFRNPAGQLEAVWVKASEFKYELETPYHAKDDKSKGAGRFIEEHEGGTHLFVWGDGSDTFACSFHKLYILDEGGEKEVDKCDCSNSFKAAHGECHKCPDKKG